MLARVHTALETLGGVPETTEAPFSMERTNDPFDEVEQRLRAMEETEHAEFALRDISARRDWMAKNGMRLASWPMRQLIHGDYQLTNILFVGDTVSAIIDWDRARVWSPVMEVVRALDHGLELAPGDCHSFLSAYRITRALPQDVVMNAVTCWTMQQAGSLWVLERAWSPATTALPSWSARSDPLLNAGRHQALSPKSLRECRLGSAARVKGIRRRSATSSTTRVGSVSSADRRGVAVGQTRRLRAGRGLRRTFAHCPQRGPFWRQRDRVSQVVVLVRSVSRRARHP